MMLLLSSKLGLFNFEEVFAYDEKGRNQYCGETNDLLGLLGLYIYIYIYIYYRHPELWI